MSRFLAPCRLCFRQLAPTRPPIPSQSRLLRRPFSQHHHRSRSNNNWSRTKVLWATAPLPPAAFVALSAPTDDGRTGEERMLETSRAEIDSAVPRILESSGKWRRRVYFFVDVWIWEPCATAIRFLHLVVIFVPVLLAIPAIWVGGRRADRSDERAGTIWWYGFLVGSMERAGAAFIKLGQWAASRTDIFPTEMCLVMSSLHSDAPAHSLDKTKKIVEKAFGGRKFDTIFEEFHTKPLGVGAIAQVYKAKLAPDLVPRGNTDISTEEPSLTSTLKQNVDFALKSSPGKAPAPSPYVAVKVLHPGVDRIVARDLRIMGFFAKLINAIPTMQWLSLPDEVTVFASMMQLQLDLRIESANLARFRKNFADRTTAWFPFPYSSVTSRQVLVEEFANGVPMEDFLQIGGGPYEEEVANEGLDAFLHMLLIDNFTHADLHPGNIMVRFYQPKRPEVPSINIFNRSQRAEEKASAMSSGAIEDSTEQVISRLTPLRNDREAWTAELQKLHTEGFQPQLIFIDTGLATELNAKNRTNFLELFRAVAEFDGYKAGHLMVQRCRQPDAVLDPEVFALRMQHLVLGVKSTTFALGNIKIGNILGEVLDMVRKHHVRLEGDFVNVVLSILLLEGIGRQLDPNMDLFAGALPIMRQLGTRSSSDMLSGGVDFGMLKVWAGLEARSWLQASIEDVERCVKYDLLSPNV